MKKSFVASSMLVAMLALSGSALANEGTATDEMPIDSGIVIDTNSSTDVVPTVVEAEVTDTSTAMPTIPEVEETDGAASADGTVLPLDQGDVNKVETGTVETVAPVETATPEEDKVVLSDKEPVVEPLPKTGIADNALLYTALAALLGAVAFVTTRRTKVEN